MKKSIKSNSYVLLVVAAPLLAQAQVAPDAGTILREQQKPALELPKRPAPAIKLDEPVRPALKPSAERIALKGFRITGNTVFAERELLAVVQDYANKDVEFADLEQAAVRISRFYRDRGYFVARAYLPAQQIQDGVVEIAVIEGRYGKVEHNNPTRVRDAVIGAHTGSLVGQTVYELKLERKLLLLSDLAGVAEARARLSPGANVGETTLSVDLVPAPPLNGSLEIDNHGNRFTGGTRVTGRLAAASPLRLGDALSAQYSHGFDGLDYARAAYQVPLGGDGVKLGGSYTYSRYRLGRTFASLDATGESHSYSADVSYPFVRTRNMNLYGRVAYLNSDFEDRVGFIGTSTDKRTRAVQAQLSGDLRDALLGGGITVFALGYADGRLNIETPTARADDDRSARTHGHYGKWNLNALRLQSLGANAALYFSLAGQKANKNLDSSEKFVLGGANGVRAYPTGEAAGDSGYLASAEWRYSYIHERLPGVLQPFAFFDAGGVTLNENPFGSGANRRTLKGGGIGVSWARAQDFQLKLTLAARIGSERAQSDTDERVRGWFQAIKYF